MEMKVQREYFKRTERMGFSVWGNGDLALAKYLWGDPDVAHYICAAGVFTDEEIESRLKTEIANYENYKIQYFPIFDLATAELVGCCGLRPFEGRMDALEIGFHLKKKYWGKGMAFEAASAMIDYAFQELHVKELHAGHNPKNIGSKKLLGKLGFCFVEELFYPPTGLMHPSYIMEAEDRQR